MKITPILLAGGQGTRLWPISRKSYPKQFSAILGEISLFQSTVSRFVSRDGLDFEKPITITHSDYRFIVAQQIKAMNQEAGQIILEPVARNTAPSVLAAAMHAIKLDSDAILLVSPSDQKVTDITAFHEAIRRAASFAEKGRIVALGIQPTQPETGYGYMQVACNSDSRILKVNTFIEKPDLETAKSIFQDGLHFWNAGIFVARAKDLIGALEEHAPELTDNVKSSLEQGVVDLDFMRLDCEAWKNCENISIDYALMEKLSNLYCLPMSLDWNDLGSWDAIWSEQNTAADGVVEINSTAIDCNNCYLRSDHGPQHLVGLGLTDIIAVATSDAVLVAHRSQSQMIKKAVVTLKEKGIGQAEIFPIDYRPWGWFERLILGDRFQVKRIFVYPGESLSLQSHVHRSEHWVVVSGTAKAEVDGESNLLTEGQSIFIPVGAIHRLENPGKVPLTLVEVQSGVYLGEDDIVRYEDRYQR